MSGGPTPVAIYRRAAGVYAKRTRFLLVLGLVVFLPVGLLDAVIDELSPTTLDEVSDAAVPLVLAAAVLQSTTVLVGDVFYAGAVGIIGRQDPDRLDLRQLARELPLLRLVAIDFVFSLAVGLGLLALVVPGVVLFVRFALAAPVVEIERCGVRAGFRRSRELTRGRFWRVLAVLAPAVVLTEAATSLGQTALARAFGHSLLVDWLGASAIYVVVTPLYALAAVLLTIDLRARATRSPPTEAGVEAAKRHGASEEASADDTRVS